MDFVLQDPNHRVFRRIAGAVLVDEIDAWSPLTETSCSGEKTHCFSDHGEGVWKLV